MVSENESFRYTLDNGKLTLQQRKFYEKNGFLLIKNNLDPALLDEFGQRFRDLCDGKIPKGEITLMKDISLRKTGARGEYLYNKVQDFNWDDVLSQYILSPQILDYVECFTGPDIVAMHSMLINKPPDSGKMTSTHPLHQDLHYFPFRPVDTIVCAWTAMEKVTVDNGCLVVIPGTHTGKLLRHDYPEWENGVNILYHGIKGYDHYPTLKLEMEKGDTILFHPLLIHGSGPNMTKGFRKAISCHFTTSRFHIIDVRGTPQEQLAKEIIEVIKRKGLGEVTIEQFWFFRMRSVRGRPPPLPSNL